jgi:hypothetical protein
MKSHSCSEVWGVVTEIQCPAPLADHPRVPAVSDCTRVGRGARVVARGRAWTRYAWPRLKLVAQELKEPDDSGPGAEPEDPAGRPAPEAAAAGAEAVPDAAPAGGAAAARKEVRRCAARRAARRDNPHENIWRISYMLCIFDIL